MAIQNRTGLGGLGLANRARKTLQVHKKMVYAVGAAAAGYVMAGSSIFGEVSPFGVAFCATWPLPYALFAGLGSIIAHIFAALPLANMKYPAAIALVLVLKWLFGVKVERRFVHIASALTTMVALSIVGVAVIVTADATLYDGMLVFAEVLLGAGSAYFFSRTLFALEAGWQNVTRADVSCMIVSFAVVVMGFSTIMVGGLSVGRILAALVVLLCARTGSEAGGAVAGITAGIAMGLAGGDYSYAIAAYGFGGLLAGVFANLGRIPTAGGFIIVNAVAAIFTKGGGDVYSALIEIFVASVVFAVIPQSAVSRFKAVRIGRTLEAEASAQDALRGRLGEVAGTLREIGSTTKEVGRRLGKLEGSDPSAIYMRVSDRVCAHCGMKTTCWQFHYSDTVNALNDAMMILKRDGTVGRARMPKHFVESCCKLEEFLAELNTQFGAYVAKEGVQRKVSRVRGVVNDQFESMAMMLEEISDELCSVTLLDRSSIQRVKDYFQREGFGVQQVRCYSDEYERITVEATIPKYEAAKLSGEQAAIDLSMLLDAELDLPYLASHGESVTAVFTEKATFLAETGMYQIAPEGNKLCGDACELIANRAGRAHFIVSDGMGSGGGAAVESHMAAGLLARLISVGFSHEAALKMVNSALLIKSGEESLATMDVCSIDLYTGHVDFFKAGAAPTFVIRGGRAGYIESTSLPAGILQGVAFDKTGLTLRESDVVVMVSDGVVASGTDWIQSELSAIGTSDMQYLAEKLAMTAKIRRGDGREDDITVLAVALRKGA